MWYGGYFDFNPITKYKGGKVRIFEKFDPDTANVIDLKGMVKEMGYNKFKLWYLKPHSILQWDVKPLRTNGDALKLAELGSKNGAIDVYIEHEGITGNEQANEAVQSPLDELVLSPLDEPIDSLLDSPLDEPVDDETGSEGHNSDMNVDVEEDDDAWLHKRDEDEEDDDHECARVNDARKNVRNYADRKNGSHGVGTSSENPGMNGNSTGEVHWDSDELVTLASSDEDRENLTIPTYSSVGDQLELYVGMKFSSQAAFRKYLVDYALKGGYNIRFIKSASWRVTAVCKGVCPWRVHASNMQRE
ncbi:hypothetical protein FEM48_Zijuj02G0111900 [Ziziphus jujuba var. spinosa]|uniref:Transposase MuDR plant domain-containing protein n=1 Tax=Ziziphus jujuba var. spinosa TaxID=714518 RepID=A0A978VVE2_ZIZJJ|nr:hypothetical protein FEM48_Zijuj02G0111900 [Ziziphus jujuba var. spinosa]